MLLQYEGSPYISWHTISFCIISVVVYIKEDPYAERFNSISRYGSAHVETVLKETKEVRVSVAPSRP